MPEKQQTQIRKIPDFDVLAENPIKAATIAKDRLQDAGHKNVRLIQHTSLGEVIPEHVEIVVNGDTVAFLYKPIACHSYNKIDVGQKEVNVGTIDTMLSFYLAFVYADKPYFNRDRILCMAMYLFRVEQKNRLEQKGLLKRFSLDCYGKQDTMEEIRAEKARKYEELKSAKNAREFEEWFLKYNPATNTGLKRGIMAAPSLNKVTKTYVVGSVSKRAKKTVRFHSPDDLLSDDLSQKALSQSLSRNALSQKALSQSLSPALKKTRRRRQRKPKPYVGPYDYRGPYKF
jgi:hypothetical protein